MVAAFQTHRHADPSYAFYLVGLAVPLLKVVLMIRLHTGFGNTTHALHTPCIYELVTGHTPLRTPFLVIPAKAGI
jgi:hypothetical protein